MNTDTVNDPTGIEITAQSVARVCEREPAVMAAYVFGSTVRPERSRPRDVDVAVLLFPSDPDVRLPLRLANALQDELGGCPVDVVVLNRAGELIKYEVRRTGRLVLDRDPERRKAFEIRGRKSFEDFCYLHRRYVRRVIYGEDHGQPHPG